MRFVFPAAIPVGPEVSAALLPFGSFFAANASQTPISQGTDNLLLSPLEDTDVITAATLSQRLQLNVQRILPLPLLFQLSVWWLTTISHKKTLL